ncbi:sensor domain-containing diguanylate cyclase [Fusibacter paucivorans]|uniref:Sensor domain-containing diguanylate cyclase n=1 Tax=Fusibacter paucivorans TaxID=76009 RepID=A0ABS5PR33_9FIRM|nr:sensor domain-containing diguanylate cyclase [Fusibacter paucivorans]MBS7527624.1 sensor domain-containing diguanylate cyclase [Fusibacter paucivorans]
MFEQLMDSLYEGIYIVDGNRKITFWNKGAERITGFKPEDVIGKYCHDNILNHVDAQGRLLCLNGCPLHMTIKDRLPRESHLFVQHKKGYRIPVTIKTVPLEGAEDPLSVAEIFTENYNVGDNIPVMACPEPELIKDQITGLPNREYLEQLLRHHISLNRTLNLQFGVILTDIDTFEEFNNIYGRRLSDDVMRMLAKTLTETFSHAEVVGRWRQDEFLFIFSGASKEQLKNLAEGIRMLSESSALRGATFKDVDVTISVGATRYHAGETMENLIARAYELLKASKRKGGNFVTVK